MMIHDHFFSDAQLRITAEIDEGGRFCVWLDDTLVRLPLARFTVLLELVLCRLTRATGYACSRDFEIGGDKPLLHQTIRRARLDFDDAIGANAGKALIRHVRASTYRLASEPGHIEISSDLKELVPEHLSWRLVDALLKASSVCQYQESALPAVAE